MQNKRRKKYSSDVVSHDLHFLALIAYDVNYFVSTRDGTASPFPLLFRNGMIFFLPYIEMTTENTPLLPKPTTSTELAKPSSQLSDKQIRIKKCIFRSLAIVLGVTFVLANLTAYVPEMEAIAQTDSFLYAIMIQAGVIVVLCILQCFLNILKSGRMQSAFMLLVYVCVNMVIMMYAVSWITRQSFRSQAD